MVLVSIYARESSKDTKIAPSIENQIKTGIEWIESEGFVHYKTFQDNGFSGGDWKRPAFFSCMEEGKACRYHILYVWNQDRIARDTEQFLHFYRQMKKGHIKIYEGSSNEYIDMETLGGRVKHQSLAQASEIFRLVTSEKVKKAYERKKARGEAWGRPVKNYDKEKAEELRRKGYGWRAIAKECGVSYQTIRKELINRVNYNDIEKAHIEALRNKESDTKIEGDKITL